LQICIPELLSRGCKGCTDGDLARVLVMVEIAETRTSHPRRDLPRVTAYPLVPEGILGPRSPSVYIFNKHFCRALIESNEATSANTRNAADSTFHSVARVIVYKF
jgi:hypothetical protein